MASKLPVVKVGGLTKKSAIRPRPHSNQSARVRGEPGSNHSQSLMASNFAALWSSDPKFSALKDLNLFKTVYKFQGASGILKVGFVRLKWPHLHRAYLVTIRKYLSPGCTLLCSLISSLQLGHYQAHQFRVGCKMSKTYLKTYNLYCTLYTHFSY